MIAKESSGHVEPHNQMSPWSPINHSYMLPALAGSAFGDELDHFDHLLKVRVSPWGLFMAFCLPHYSIDAGLKCQWKSLALLTLHLVASISRFYSSPVTYDSMTSLENKSLNDNKWRLMTWFSPFCQLDIQSIAVMAGEGSRHFKHLPWHRPSAARSDSPSGAASQRPQKLGQLEGWAATASVWKFEATKMEIWKDWQEVNPIYRRSTISRLGSVGCFNRAFLGPKFWRTEGITKPKPA